MVIESGRDTKSFLLKNLWKPWKTLAPIDADAYERGYDRYRKHRKKVKLMRLIDADEFIEYCRKGLKDMSAIPYYKDDIKAMTEVTKSFVEDIEEQPTVDAAPVVHAHWIPEYLLCNPRTGKAYRYNCSKCGKGVYSPRQLSVSELGYDFCPHCGAKMDEY